MTPQQIIDGLTKRNNELSYKNDELQELSEKHAEAKRDYAIALQQKIVVLKTEGQPVTVIKELAKGDKHVAQLRFERDVAEGVLNACRERIKDIRAAIDTYRSILTWLREEYHRS